MLAVFFALIGLSSGGITMFGIPALTTGYGQTYSAASFALTAYMMASAVGVLAGGLLADWTRHHARVAMVCFALNLLLTLAIAVTAPGTIALTLILTLAGFLYGLITPSRDMMVRNAAPSGAAGRAFGIVSTGFKVSGILAPLLFGFIMDQALPRWVFGLSAAFMIPALLLTMVTDRRSSAPHRAAQRA
jgi:MFS family permease